MIQKRLWKYMSLAEIKKRENELKEELEKLARLRVNLEQEKFRENIGKYYRFNVESVYNGYIKIDNIWGAPHYVIEGLWFDANTSEAAHNNAFDFWAWKQFIINHPVKSWNDFHLTEVSEEEFIKAFNKAIDTEKQLFIKFIK